MAKVLFVGIEPDQVDFSDPSLPPGMNAETIREGVRRSVEGLTAAGHTVDQLYVPAAREAAVSVFSARLAAAQPALVVIGGGVIIPPANRLLFEGLLNAIVKQSPPPAVGLIARPEDAPAAAARILSGG